MFPTLFRKEVEDEFSQENFTRIQDYFKDLALDRGSFQFLEIPVTGAVTNKKFKHRLGFVPKDILLTHNLNNQSVTWNYSLFSATDLDFNCAGTTVLRIFVGRYE